MIVDLKYHIASLAAVFLALAIGVVTGTVMLGNDTIVWQQERMTNSLESEISNLRDNNLELRKKTEKLDKQVLLNSRFEQGVLPQLISNRLTGMKVVVIDTCSRELGGDISQLLTQSGAQVAKVVELMPAYGGTSGIPAALATVGGGKPASSWEEVSRRLADEILMSASSQVLAVLRQNQLVKIPLAQPAPVTADAQEVIAPEQKAAVDEQKAAVDQQKVDAVILLGGSKRRDLPRRQFEYTDLPMIKYFKEHGVRVVGVEPVETSVSYIPDFKRYNLTTVDNVDTIAGKLSLVLAIEGSQGNFGIKSTAKQYLPLQ